MAVPKKRTGKSAQGHRRSNWKATKPEVTNCTKCGALVLTHTVCAECGYYKGKPASIKHEDAQVAVKEEPKAKKAPKKKAEPKPEAAVEAAEEVKPEASEEATEKKPKKTAKKAEETAEDKAE